MKKKHEHIWKYIGAGYERVCEAPIPTIPSCGRKEIKVNDKWIFNYAKEI